MNRLGLTLALALVMPACGGDGSAPAAQPGTAPTAAPSPGPSASPSPSISPVSWQNVLETKDCPYPDCPARDGFLVNALGQYFYGSTGGNSLSQRDFNKLEDQVFRVASQDLSGSPTCVAITPAPGMSGLTIDLTLGDGSVARVYDLSTRLSRECWLGDRGRAKQLADTVDELASAYAPSPSPSPSESPTASPSPSELPSP